MANLLLYSTNPWFTYDIGKRYRNGKYYVWCSEHFDPRKAPSASSASMIAPSSSPKGIFDNLASDCALEDSHSALIKGYRKTFKRLAKTWFANNLISKVEMEEIISTADSPSWNIWRPVLFIIPRAAIAPSRIVHVSAKSRAAYGSEFQIHDLDITEFEIIER